MMYHKEVGVDPCNYVTFDTIDNIDIMLDWCIAEPVNVMPNDEMTECFILSHGKKARTVPIIRNMAPIDFICTVVQAAREVIKEHEK